MASIVFVHHGRFDVSRNAVLATSKYLQSSRPQRTFHSFSFPILSSTYSCVPYAIISFSTHSIVVITWNKPKHHINRTKISLGRLQRLVVVKFQSHAVFLKHRLKVDCLAEKLHRSCVHFRLRERGMNIEDFNYTNSEITHEIYSAMNSTRFLGVSVSEMYRWTIYQSQLYTRQLMTAPTPRSQFVICLLSFLGIFLSASWC